MNKMIACCGINCETCEARIATIKKDGRTIVMVTHNEKQASQTDRIIKFLDGRQIM